MESPMSKFLQILLFLALITMPLWSGYAFRMEANGSHIEEVGADR